MYLIGLTTRIIDNGFQLNLIYNHTNIYCKIRNYLVYALFSISSWLCVLVSFDHLFSTNQSTLQRQYYSSYRMAFKLIFLIILICLLVHLHMIIYHGYYLELNSYNQLILICTTNVFIYNVFYAFFILIFYSLLPPLLLSIINILTIKNFRNKSNKRICKFGFKYYTNFTLY